MQFAKFDFATSAYAARVVAQADALLRLMSEARRQSSSREGDSNFGSGVDSSSEDDAEAILLQIEEFKNSQMKDFHATMRPPLTVPPLDQLRLRRSSSSSIKSKLLQQSAGEEEECSCAAL